jgi:preprotein translocase subunit SecF
VGNDAQVAGAVLKQDIVMFIDFLKYRYFCYAVSAVVLVVGVILYFQVGGFRYHIDFAGGTELRVRFAQSVDIAALRERARQKGWGDAQIQSLGDESREYLIRVGLEHKDVEQHFKQEIATAFADNAVTIVSKDQVGAEAGREVKWNAFKAIAISLVLLLIYLGFRMQYAYGVGAVVALAHDLVAVLLYLLIFRVPISLHVLAAILAILGYSINEIINTSINQTLRRTILTSFATLLSLVALWLIGGEALKGFSTTMLIGVIVGTYSSIYIASPVMLAVSGYRIE